MSETEADCIRKEHYLLYKAASDLIGSLGKVYAGHPGKLEWPELHYLKQAVEKVGSDMLTRIKGRATITTETEG